MTKPQRRERCASAQTKKAWSDFTPCQRTVMVAGAVVQVTLLAAAQIDITRRPKEQIRGAKLLWRLLVLINFIGPIAYFAIGRKRPAATEPAEGPAEAEEPVEEPQPESETTDDPDQT